MSRLSSTLLTLLTAALLSTWIASCSEDSPTTCVPGVTRLCAGLGRCQGSQICLEDGSGYGECDCTPAPDDMMSMEDDTQRSVVGRPCTANEQCGEGLTCLTSEGNDFFGGGAPNGYCTATCTANTDCTAIDPQSDCFNEEATGTGLCVRQCLSKDPESLAENKCLGRHDVVCNSEVILGLAAPGLQRQRGWCLPQCTSDEDCGDRRCSLATGLCTEAPPAGAAIGERCATNEDCASRDCVSVSTTSSDAFCSASCQVGSPVGCGYGLTADPREAACVLPRVRGGTFGLEDEGVGDVGFCFELCDVDTDCAQSAGGWFCLQAAPPGEFFGRSGFCADPSARDPLPDAGISTDGGVVPADAGPDANPGVTDASAPGDAG